MINVVIFSKDRACQLSILLCSMMECFKEFNDTEIMIIYTYSNDDFKKGYDKLINMWFNYKNINFIKQNNFKDDVIKNICIYNEFTVFGVDDDVFIRDFSLKDDLFETFKEDYNNDVICLSLRMHEKINYCYTENKEYHTFFPQKGEENIWWEWNREDGGDQAYPMSLDFHIFRTNFILPLLKELDYKSPNTLEGILHKNLIRFYDKPYMIAYKEARIINIAINKVQTDNSNICGKIKADFLNKKFLDGYIGELNVKDLMNKNSCHVESDFVFYKMDNWRGYEL